MTDNRPAPKQEQEILDLLLPFAADPLGFVMACFPWGEQGTQLERFSGPKKWQCDELEAIGREVRRNIFAKDNALPMQVIRVAHSSGRGPGKSALQAMIACWHISTHPGASGLVVTNTENQARDVVFKELNKWFSLALNSHWFVLEGLRVSVEPWLTDMWKREIKTDLAQWGISSRNWNEDNPDSFVGGHNPNGLFVLFEEASGIPAVFWDKTTGFFQDPDPSPYRLWMAASQTRRASGRFFDLFYNEKFTHANEAGRQPEWRTRIMNVMLPEYQTDPAEVQKFIEQHGVDSDEVRIEVMGLPPRQSDNQLVSPLVVREAMARTMIFDDNEPLIMGVDPAPRGRTAIRFRQGRDARSIPAIVLNGKDNVQIADEVVKLIDLYNPDAVCIDAGMGTGVIDVLKRRRVKCHEVWFGSAALSNKDWATRGSELWALLVEWLPGGALPASDERLFEDLTRREWKWFGREENKKILESKKELRERYPNYSPDDADALALTFHVNPPRRDRKSRRDGLGAGAVIAQGVDESLFGPG